MRIFEPHIHMVSRITDDYVAMASAGVELVLEPAFWLGQPRTQVGTFVDYWESLLGYEVTRARQFGIEHVSIDNMVHVGHNCDIGERVVIAAQTGISGSVIIEDDCVIGGQVGFGDHIRVQSGAVIGSKAGVLPGKIVRPGVWWGIPIQPLAEYKRLNAHISRLPHVRKEIKQLKDRVQELETQLSERNK